MNDRQIDELHDTLMDELNKDYLPVCIFLAIVILIEIVLLICEKMG